MYIPKVNAANNRDDVVDFMQKFSFATIITTKGGIPEATHLPFLVSIRDGHVVLASHFAKANEQWKNIEEETSLVIFSEPHAYISTKHYDKELNVPTWNYIAVHAYGKCKIIPEPQIALSVINATIDNYEQEYRAKWDGFSQDYKLKMLNGIVTFELLVTDLQAKNKLSQNRSETEKDKIISALSASSDTNERLTADYMHKERNL